MLATAPRSRRKPQVGSPRPRVAPPTPARSGLKDFTATAESIGISLWPWQESAARYLTALGIGDRWLYREVAIIVARQNGKTELLLPLIVGRLLEGKRIMHTAQNRELPREIHRRLGALLLEHFPMELVPRGTRYGAGQEEIRLLNGGHYRIVAPSTSGARGTTNDLVIVDELREMADHDFIAAAKPTMSASPNPQMVYLSNAGTMSSTVLNALKSRATGDPKLAYLEWSAGPERKPDDIAGWLEANPAIGHSPGLMENLGDDYRADLLGGTMANFETEHLCRWVASMDERLVTDDVWTGQDFGDLGAVTRPVMAVKMDISGERLGAVVAWQGEDKRVSLDVVADVHGSPIDVNRLGPDLVKVARDARASIVAFDPYTDADLIRFFHKTKAVIGRDYANASEGFVRRAKAKEFLVHDEMNILRDDLAWTVRKSGQHGSYIAVKADDEHTNVVAEAAIRASWLATVPAQTERSRIW